MDEDATWYGSLRQCGPGHMVLDGSQLPAKGAQQPPVFGPCLFWVPTGSPISAAAELFTVTLLMGIQWCQTLSPSVDRSRCIPHLFPFPFLSSPPLPITSLSSAPSPLRSRRPDCDLEVSGRALSLGLQRVRSPAAKRILVHCMYKLAPF